MLVIPVAVRVKKKESWFGWAEVNFLVTVSVIQI